MDTFNSILIFVGSNIKIFVISIFLRFIAFMSILFLSLTAFFSIGDLLRKPFYSLLFFLTILFINYVVNNRLFAGNSLILLKKYSEYNDKSKYGTGIELNTKSINMNKKKIRNLLNSFNIRFIPERFLFVFSLINDKYEKRITIDEKDVRNSLSDHYKQMVIEYVINLVISIPFFLISVLFTLGSSIEIILLSLFMALIFFLFIKSALINPIFLLMTHKKLFYIFISQYL